MQGFVAVVVNGLLWICRVLRPVGKKKVCYEEPILTSNCIQNSSVRSPSLPALIIGRMQCNWNV